MRRLDGVGLCPELTTSSNELFASSSVRLPGDHIEFLKLANGALSCQGYVRLFGVACSGCTDLRAWNARDTWKFAWPQHVMRYLAFGETAWGDQYAYDVSALLHEDTSVFALDAFEMQPERIAATFSDFLRNEFLRQAAEPYDSMTERVLKRIGSLSWNEHVTYVPSLLLGGEERIENVQKINARAGMIINGDIATQSAEEPDRSPAAIETYTDDAGRTRVRLRWR
ncbi:MAG TPA: SMI1/KNR4 family protein [Thermoanaerobaculia bacterium]|nr:SMI1/KNR4 family protein [Thermoanaerobaculia bacterium]